MLLTIYGKPKRDSHFSNIGSVNTEKSNKIYNTQIKSIFHILKRQSSGSNSQKSIQIPLNLILKDFSITEKDKRNNSTNHY